MAWRTSDPGSYPNPAWLADSRLVHERIAERGTLLEIHAVDTETDETTFSSPNMTPNTPFSRPVHPGSHPTGTRLALALSEDGWEHLYAVEPPGERCQLTSGEFEDKGLAAGVSRWVDDETLVFSSNRRDLGERGVYTVSIADGTVRLVVETRGTNISPRPSPSGDWFAYLHAENRFARTPSDAARCIRHEYYRCDSTYGPRRRQLARPSHRTRARRSREYRWTRHRNVPH